MVPIRVPAFACSVCLGLSGSLRLLVVVHSYRAESNTIRIVSARKATRRESKFYP
ncbi:MAG: BrnT family toxin [Betaproteobacteria bacterium]|nr:BrnT family toxin [Betaproteobacteria bacterium]